MASRELPPPLAGDVEVAPILMEHFMVQGVGFCCLAYFDEDGKWRDALTDEELPEVLHVLQ